MKILVAEDDLTSRNILASVLGKWRYEVIAACDGNEAWDVLQKPKAPMLALLDWMMPGMDGIQLCQMIREQDTLNPMYLILLTHRQEKEDIVQGLKAGANDYIIKPYHIEELRARLDVGKRVIELQATLAKRIDELQDALSHVKTLQGILPICCFCHSIRTDKESWERIEKYITEHSEAKFSHSICPECMEQHYPEII